MNATEMIGLMNKKPFLPLEIHMADGSKVTVSQFYEIATRTNSPTCTVYEESDNSMQIISYRNITRIATQTIEEETSSS